MKYKQMLAFRMVMITGSVSQAAERIHISQPAVSNLISSLEQHFGFKLFERRKGRLIPTPDAHHIYENVSKALSGFEKVSQSAHDIRDQKSGSLRIACMPVLSIEFMPAVISEFLADRDDISVNLQVQPSIKIQRWIAADLYDIGIAELPLIHSGIESEQFNFKCVCALPEGHSLLKHETLTPRELDNESFISLNSDHMTHQQTQQAFANAGARWKVRVETQLFHSAARLAKKCHGVAILDPFTMMDSHYLGLKTRPFLPNIEYKIGILYSAEHPRSLLAGEFLKLLRKRLLNFAPNT
jgi:DNA-binding transcriptional LysR family regulator